MPKDSDDLGINERVVIKAEGVIQNINADGSFDIFNKSDGKLLKNMPSSIVTAWKKRSLNKGPRGMTLVANYRGSGEWLTGTISDERDDGTFTFSYDDGKIETKVQKSRIRYEFRSDDATEKEPKSYWGWEVEWRGKDGKLAIGRVVAEDENGDIYVKYGPTDKAKVVTVTKKDIKPLNPPITHSSDGDGQDLANVANSGKDDDLSGIYFSQDDAVEVYDKNTSKWLSGTVILCRTDGTYDVELKSGVSERVPADDMRHPTNKSESSNNTKDSASATKKSTSTSAAAAANDTDTPVIHNYWGPKVEVKQKDVDDWIVGRVTGESNDERFQITYSNNRIELVTKDDIRLFKKISSSHAPSPKHKDNKHTEVDHAKNSHSKESASHGKKNHNQTNTTKEDPHKHTYTIGQRVCVDYKGEGKYYKGRIIAVKSHEKYNIEYDDGDIENNVPVIRIQLRVPPSNHPVPTATTASEIVESYYGPLVKANYRGSGKWSVGRVTGETRDGGFEITYEHSKEVEIVGKRDIRPLEAAEAEELAAIASNNKNRPQGGESAHSKDSRRDRRSAESRDHITATTAATTVNAYSVDEEVEVNFPEEDIWLRGIVALVRSNGSIDVEFIDDSFGQRIDPHFVRKFIVPRSARRSQPSREESRDRDSGNNRHISYDRNNVPSSHARAERYDSSPESGRRHRDGAGSASHSRAEREYTTRGNNTRYMNEDDDAEYDRYDSRTTRKHPTVASATTAVSASPTQRDSRDSRSHGNSRRGRDDSVSPVRTRMDAASTSGNKRVTSSAVMAFTTGDDVECDFTGKGNWKVGRVRSARSDGTFDIRFEGSSGELNVPLECLRPVARGAPRSGNRGSASPSRGMKEMSLSPSAGGSGSGSRGHYSNGRDREQYDD